MTQIIKCELKKDQFYLHSEAFLKSVFHNLIVTKIYNE